MLDDETEYPGHTGPSDLIVFCERKCGGVSEKYAYIWEVKAPQADVFVKDTENRVKSVYLDGCKALSRQRSYGLYCRTL